MALLSEYTKFGLLTIAPKFGDPEHLSMVFDGGVEERADWPLAQLRGAHQLTQQIELVGAVGDQSAAQTRCRRHLEAVLRRHCGPGRQERRQHEDAGSDPGRSHYSASLASSRNGT